MSDEHKEALAKGRRASRAVSAYLEALESAKKKRGRRRTTDSIHKRLAQIETEIDAASALRRLQLAQERLDLAAELEALLNESESNIEELETAFIEHALHYAESKGISYAVWREAGVEARVLKSAGIRRTR